MRSTDSREVGAECPDPTAPVPVVTILPAGELDSVLARSCDALGPSALAKIDGARVLLKANCNSPDPPPASSDPAFLRALVGALRNRGARSVTLGASCGLRWRPAADIHRRLGLDRLAGEMGVEYVNFDAGPWRTVPIAGKKTTQVDVAEAVFTHDCVVYAACMKTHRAARFSLSLKHAVGLLSPESRRSIHLGDVEQRIADINLAVSPDLLFVDARTCFVSGGPARGWVRRPGLVMASTDRIALDVEALRVLRGYFALNRLPRDAWSSGQVRAAVELGLGVSGENGYRVVTS